jgi:hypothetical protein
MIKSMLKLGAFTLLLASLTGVPALLQAQTNVNAAPAPEKKAAPEKKPAAGKKKSADKNKAAQKKPKTMPFDGTLTALDKVVKTITVGERTFQITSETRLYKGAKTPATLEEGVVGEPVRGSYEQGPEGKLLASSVYFGPKADAKSTGTKPAAKKEKK